MALVNRFAQPALTHRFLSNLSGMGHSSMPYSRRMRAIGLQETLAASG
jgi:hypothetical protein